MCGSGCGSTEANWRCALVAGHLSVKLECGGGPHGAEQLRREPSLRGCSGAGGIATGVGGYIQRRAERRAASRTGLRRCRGGALVPRLLRPGARTVRWGTLRAVAELCGISSQPASTAFVLTASPPLLRPVCIGSGCATVRSVKRSSSLNSPRGNRKPPIPKQLSPATSRSKSSANRQLADQLEQLQQSMVSMQARIGVLELAGVSSHLVSNQ